MHSGLCLAAGWIAITQVIAGQEPDVSFKTRVNLVSVPVVVRDKKGLAVGNLEKADFQLFDKGKPQIISRFSMETGGSKPAADAPEKIEDKDVPAASQLLPERFVAYLFDDVHLTFGDLVWLRDAARRHLVGLSRSDRAGIYTTSGQIMLDFTDDRDAWHATLLRLSPRPMAMRSNYDCPNLNYYHANQIVNRSDSFALQAATAETIVCANLDASMRSIAESIARAAAQRVVAENEQETRVSLSVLRDVVRRMGTTPGQRIIVLASPGFIATESQLYKNDIIDRAIRAGVIISAIDGRGLWVDSTFDASKPGYAQQVAMVKNQYDRDSASVQSDVLAEFAAGTGGTFFKNSNDLDDGFKRVAAAPEYTYFLGFSPQDLKMDGSYHTLKVSLPAKKGLSVLARKGYYAPKTLVNPAEAASEEIRDALFSRQERNELPVTLKSGFMRQGNRTTVQVHIDVKSLRFRKADGVNYNDLTVTLGLFDRNGNLVRSIQKILKMSLKDETLAQRGDAGFLVGAEFDVAAGSYLVRMVARDSEGEQMSARNGTIEIE